MMTKCSFYLIIGHVGDDYVGCLTRIFHAVNIIARDMDQERFYHLRHKVCFPGELLNSFRSKNFCYICQIKSYYRKAFNNEVAGISVWYVRREHSRDIS